MLDTRFPVSVHLMALLAYEPETQRTSADLASSLKTNPAFVRKLVSPLVDAGLIESSRGKGGGLRLGKPPEAISLQAIYLASVQDKQLVCLPQKRPKASCPVSCSMGNVLGGIVEGVEQATLGYLASRSLADVLQALRK